MPRTRVSRLLFWGWLSEAVGNSEGRGQFCWGTTRYQSGVKMSFKHFLESGQEFREDGAK